MPQPVCQTVSLRDPRRHYRHRTTYADSCPPVLSEPQALHKRPASKHPELPAGFSLLALHVSENFRHPHAVNCPRIIMSEGKDFGLTHH